LSGITPDEVQKVLQSEIKEQFLRFLESMITEKKPPSSEKLDLNLDIPIEDSASNNELPASSKSCPDPDAFNFIKNFQKYVADVVLKVNLI
jgi:hypothetical protein